MNILGYFLAITLVLFGLIITSLNAGSVPFNYYLGSCHLPLSLLLILSFGAGAFLGLFINFVRHLRQRNAYRQLQQHTQKLETEVTRLHTLETQATLHRLHSREERSE